MRDWCVIGELPKPGQFDLPRERGGWGVSVGGEGIDQAVGGVFGGLYVSHVCVRHIVC